MTKLSGAEKEKEIPKTFWEIWEENKGYVFNVCLILTNRHYQDAQDLHSEVMLKASLKSVKELPKVNARSWLSNLASNTFIDKVRRKERRESKFNHYGSVKDLEKICQNRQSSPLDKLLENETSDCVEICLSNMPARRRHISNLYFSGYTYAELAETFLISEESARKMVQTSRDEVKNYLLGQKSGQEQKCETKINSEELSTSLHLVTYKHSGETHYCSMASEVSMARLEQKAVSLKKYLTHHETSYDKKLILAEFLSLLGQFKEAITLLDELLQDGYHHHKVYDLKIAIYEILDNTPKILEVTENAQGNLITNTRVFEIQSLVAKERFDLAYQKIRRFTNDSLKLELIKLRLKLLLCLDRKEKALELCREINLRGQECPSCSKIHLELLLTLKGFQEAFKYVKEVYEKSPNSPIQVFLYLHFLIRLGKENQRDFKSAFTYVRKNYFRHPEIALIKALMFPFKALKILLRRTKDYPSCILSKAYLRLFNGANWQSLNLNSYEKQHIKILGMIHGDLRRVEQ